MEPTSAIAAAVGTMGAFVLLLILSVLLILAPLGIWWTVRKIRQENMTAMREICSRLDALIVANGGKSIPTSAAITSSAPRAGGYSSVRQKGWNK